MTKLELIQQNKKMYEAQLKKNEYMDGLSKLVGEYLMLPWIKGTNWMGGLSDSKANKAFEKIMLYGYDFDEIDDEWQKQMDEQLPLVESKLNENQYYGLNDDGDAVYVAMSEKEVINYAKKHPEEGIIRVEDKFKHGYNLKESYIITESLKKWDKKEFEDNSNSYELEMLYESVKNTLSAQQKNDLVKFVIKARTADEINTYMTGMLVKDQANESLQESSHFEYGNAVSKANQAVDIIDFASDKDNKEIYLGASVVVPQQLGYADREAQVEDIFVNKHGVEMLRVRYNDSKIENVAAKSCTLIEGLSEDVNEESFNKLKEIAYELDDYVEDKVWVRDFWFDGQFENTISFEIYGDWKHDHARFDYYAKEWLDNKGLKYKIWETITDEDGSDTYGATHIIRLYDFINEGYISQKDQKFSNGPLNKFDPKDFMQKILNSGQSMNTVRTCGDYYYTIFVNYKNHFGPKGIDDLNTEYILDIIKEDSSGDQTRELTERGKVSDIIEKLKQWRDETCLVDDMRKNASLPY